MRSTIKLFWALLTNNRLLVLDIRGHVQFVHCTRDFLLHSKHSCITNVSMRRDLRSKVQHLQRDLRLEVQHLLMLCIQGVSLLLPFVMLHSNSLL